MSDTRRDVLLFDLGGVLIHFEGFDALNRLLGGRLSPDEIRTRWIGSSAVTDFECGHIAPDTFARRFVEEWELDWAPADFLETFASWVEPLPAEAESILAALAPTHRLACLSNCNEVHWPRINGANPHFDESFLSFRMGVAKPARLIFERVVTSLDVAPDRITFFDDTDENLSAAAAVGLRVERVRGLPNLRKRLETLGKLPAGS